MGARWYNARFRVRRGVCTAGEYEHRCVDECLVGLRGGWRTIRGAGAGQRRSAKRRSVAPAVVKRMGIWLNIYSARYFLFRKLTVGYVRWRGTDTGATQPTQITGSENLVTGQPVGEIAVIGVASLRPHGRLLLIDPCQRFRRQLLLQSLALLLQIRQFLTQLSDARAQVFSWTTRRGTRQSVAR